jgi:uncharacterized protein YceK
MVRAAFVLLAGCAPLLSGCGTFADALAGPVDDHFYYRGVRLDVAVIMEGLPLMALDIPFSALADTLAVPSIAYHHWTDPPETLHKSALQAAGEEAGRAFTNGVIAPMTAEITKANAEMENQQPSPQVVNPVFRKYNYQANSPN